ncbi:peptidase [Pilimelia terevasa]|uniref:Aminopeptidase N n=1 Tax=Pilimelia terevasa TaxID=53372 RepID=A0A8J3BR51_9ACTN|nr:M1 family metallopeptidase [Pilimelia terevasa]GGK21788.1 peptidase [Pilimelia terevasa]
MRRAFTVATAAVLTLTLAAPADARAAGAGPGSAGIGDSYYPLYGNGGYDAAHYDVRLRYHHDQGRLTGTTTMLATATQDLNRFNLDFALDVQSVRVNDRPAAFVREQGRELIVTPAKEIRSGERLNVVVTYDDRPATKVVDGHVGWKATRDGVTMLGEPEAALWWFPSNDHPTDKATFDVSVQVPERLAALSNGLQNGPPTQPIAGWKRWSWRNDLPTATYLQFLMIGDYEIVTDEINGLPSINAYHKDLGPALPAAKASIERTAEIVEWESSLLGPYPFHTLGGIAGPSDGFRSALEVQGRPYYGPGFWSRGSNTSVVVHELAHQWFGDSVSVKDWRDIWLNEGWATYLEWLWSERNGEGTAQELSDYAYVKEPVDSAFWQVMPGDPGASDLFHRAVYNRGAMTVHQLRLALGDEKFFHFVQEWQKTHKYGVGTITEFQQAASVAAGRDLGPMFRTWLFTKGRPAAPQAHRATPAEPRSWQRIAEAHEQVHQHEDLGRTHHGHDHHGHDHHGHAHGHAGHQH